MLRWPYFLFLLLTLSCSQSSTVDATGSADVATDQTSVDLTDAAPPDASTARDVSVGVDTGSMQDLIHPDLGTEDAISVDASGFDSSAADIAQDLFSDLDQHVVQDLAQDQLTTANPEDWIQCKTNKDCSDSLGPSSQCNTNFPGGKCNCNVDDDACSLLGTGVNTLTCAGGLGMGTCQWDHFDNTQECPSWLDKGYTQGSYYCVLKTCDTDDQCKPFVCRSLSGNPTDTHYCLTPI